MKPEKYSLAVAKKMALLCNAGNAIYQGESSSSIRPAQASFIPGLP
jgi:hypothetical protein